MRIDISGLRREGRHPARPESAARGGVAVVTSPLAELCMALHVLAEPGHHPGLQAWVAGVTARLDPCLADSMGEADFLWRTTFSDVFVPAAGLPGGTLPGATLAEDLDLLDRLSDEQFVDAALEFTCALPYDTRPARVLADPAMRERALELAAARGPQPVRFTRRLLEDPPHVRVWLRRFLEDCDEAFFADVWSRMRHQLTADARHKTDILRRKGLAEALTAVSPVVTLDEDEQRITVDKLNEGRTSTADGSLLLIPTSLGRPHLMVLHRYGWQPVLHYPVSSPAPAAPPSVEQLTLRMTALSHPVRMRMCRHLARSAFTTGELAKVEGMSAPEISRHLALLKKAGLITTRRRGRYVLHQLDVTVVARLGGDFLEGVLR
ncbi:transcriptional regulator [Streptomyces minutiscleroticus]|uniref:Transcriptional regulator n=1 Tax=Streptomyces minutiscleroticus TaxID=68238 RepID=A0A918U678_9ACTN|nr:transcriptional regulator [Streptomyces minutiscleroticus]